MRAMIIRRHGGPEVFEGADIPSPEPQPGAVRVRVVASSVNPADIGARAGSMHAGDLPAVLGFDVAGQIESIGPGVSGWSIGDRVLYPIPPGLPTGGYGEFHVVPAALLSPVPEGVGMEEAGVTPVAGGTAFACVVTHGRVRLGDRVLVHGAAGGVGHFAVQIAKTAGAYVAATCHSDQADFVRELGADEIVPYDQGDFASKIRGIDLAVVTVGGDTFAKTLDVMSPQGRMITMTGPTTGLEPRLMQAVMKNLSLQFVHLDDPAEKLAPLGRLMQRGLVRPHIAKTFPLESVGDAHRVVENREIRFGKVAVTQS